MVVTTLLNEDEDEAVSLSPGEGGRLGNRCEGRDTCSSCPIRYCEAKQVSVESAARNGRGMERSDILARATEHHVLPDEQERLVDL